MDLVLLRELDHNVADLKRDKSAESSSKEGEKGGGEWRWKGEKVRNDTKGKEGGRRERVKRWSGRRGYRMSRLGADVMVRFDVGRDSDVVWEKGRGGGMEEEGRVLSDMEESRGGWMRTER